MRLFAADSSLFTRVEGVKQALDKLVNDLKTVATWAHQWKMVFNPNISKQARWCIGIKIVQKSVEIFFFLNSPTLRKNYRRFRICPYFLSDL